MMIIIHHYYSSNLKDNMHQMLIHPPLQTAITTRSNRSNDQQTKDAK